MTVTEIDSGAAAELVALAAFAAAQGWVPATSGNFSCRLDAGHAAVTRSGLDKGSLRGAQDLAVVALGAPLPPGVSAETPLHVARYRRDPSIGAIAHVHSLAATVLSRADAALGCVTIEGFEMQKAFEGCTTHEGTIRLPVFANAQDTQALAEHVEEALPDTPEAPGYLLAGHGLYAWGPSVAATRRHLEGLEFLLRCVLEERRVRR